MWTVCMLKYLCTTLSRWITSAVHILLLSPFKGDPMHVCVCLCVCVQVYAFGNTSVTLDNVHSSIRALINNRWTPVTLETLVANNMKGKS